jgi:hypothetical protein
MKSSSAFEWDVQIFRRFRWGAIALLLCVGSNALADALENRMKECNWTYFPQNIDRFREQRKHLPSEISISMRSCDQGGPQYAVKTTRKVVLVQDGWLEGEQSTAHFFSTRQPNEQHWEFRYQGYEWSGYLLINRKTGRKARSPGNQCGEMVFSPDSKRAFVVCVPDYGVETTELFLVSFDDKVAFKKLQKNPPQGTLLVDWSVVGEAKVTFRTIQSQSVRRFRI